MANFKLNFLMILATGNLYALNSFAQELIKKPWTSKYSLSSASSCGNSELLVGIVVKHQNGQNLTYQESFRALCAKSKVKLFSAPNTGLVKKQNTHSRRSCENSFATSVLFHHGNGQNYTYQESFGMHCKKPKRKSSSCYFSPWKTKGNLSENFQCRAGVASTVAYMQKF